MVFRAYAAYLDAKFLPTRADELTGEHKYSPEAIEGMQRAILDALRADGPLPEEIRTDLAFAFEETCAGIASDLLQPVKRRGGRERPIAKHMQAAAIRYLRWVEDGRINDDKPTSTVADAFGVNARTVRNWKEAWRDSSTPSIDDEFGAEAVAKFMKAIGAQYRRFVKKPSPKGW